MLYYIFVNNEQQGPYSIEELRLRHITSDTLARSESEEQWKPAWTVQGLDAIFRESQTNTESNVSREVETPYAAEQVPQPSSGHGKSWLTKLIILLLVVIALATTCPSKQEHKEAVMNELKSYIDKRTSDSDDKANAAIGNLFVSSVLGWAMDSMIEVRNYGLCSVGEMHFQGKTKTVSFGILNHVFVFNLGKQ